MDANKLAKLKEVNYRIAKSCGFCIHASFAPTQDWGTCKKHEYDHLKHTDAKRALSIYRGGICDGFEENGPEMEQLNRFQEFVR